MVRPTYGNFLSPNAVFCLASAWKERTSTTVVFFLGGCTYTEIAALRWAGSQTQGILVIVVRTILPNLLLGRKFLIATTGMVSGGSMIESIAGVGRAGASSKEASL